MHVLSLLEIVPVGIFYRYFKIFLLKPNDAFFVIPLQQTLYNFPCMLLKSKEHRVIATFSNPCSFLRNKSAGVAGDKSAAQRGLPCTSVCALWADEVISSRGCSSLVRFQMHWVCLFHNIIKLNEISISLVYR